MQNILQVEAMGMSQVTLPCAACYGRFRAADYQLKNDPKLRRRFESVLGAEYHSSVSIVHLLDLLVNQIGPEVIREKVVKPLSGLRLACYYGCLLTRPPKVVAFDNPDFPSTMERLMQATGASTVEWPYKTECCGATLGISYMEAASRLIVSILRDALRAGAEMVVTACPLCQPNLEIRQEEAARTMGQTLQVPVVYFTQLLALALGCDFKDLELDKNFVNPLPLLRQKGLVPGA
jgi:heterodisulfide reductase subunit B